GDKWMWRLPNSTAFVVTKANKGFVHYNPWLWEQHFGKPPKGMIVRNFSAKLLDVTISDLKLITQEENGRINSINRTPKHLRETKALIKQLNKLIINTEKS